MNEQYPAVTNYGGAQGRLPREVEQKPPEQPIVARLNRSCSRVQEAIGRLENMIDHILGNPNKPPVETVGPTLNLTDVTNTLDGATDQLLGRISFLDRTLG